MKYLLTLLLAVVFSSAAFSQTEVKIGKQVWMSKNLDVSTYRNGEAIPEAKNVKQWIKASKNKTAAFCYYEYDSKNGKVYGKLYNWYAVNDSRGLAPKGYHIPSDEEWTILTDFLGGIEIAGKKMKSKDGWSYNGDSSRFNGDNSSGFNGLPGGHWYHDGDLGIVTGSGNWWSSSESGTYGFWGRSLGSYYAEVSRSYNEKYDGLSVRCLRD